MIPTPLPDYPWQQVGVDLFKLGNKQYLLAVEYFSRFRKVIKLTSTTSTNVIATSKSIFSCHGVPEIVRSDNGPQYTWKEFVQFAQMPRCMAVLYKYECVVEVLIITIAQYGTLSKAIVTTSTLYTLDVKRTFR